MESSKFGNLGEGLKKSGWTEVSPDWQYTKGQWTIFRDTSSWLMVGTNRNPLVFEVHSPSEYESSWTVNLIEHLCQMEDERCRLRDALEGIRKAQGSLQMAKQIAEDTLSECFHKWLGDTEKPGVYQCPICGRTKPSNHLNPK